MHEVYFGDEVTRWRCMCCDMVYSSIEWALGDGEIVRMGWWARKRKNNAEMVKAQRG